MGKMARAAEPLYESWRDSILTFAREGMNFHFTDQQQSLFDLVEMESTMPIHERKKRIAVRSGQGPGKTAASVIVALWRCLQYEDALVIVTSPSMRQCKQWVDECNRLTKTAHPIIRKMVKCFGTKVEINGSKMWGIRTATATRPENLQGIHEKHLTFIADEASGVSAAIIETIPTKNVPVISQGEIVSQLLFFCRKVRVSISIVRCALVAMLFKSVLKLSN